MQRVGKLRHGAHTLPTDISRSFTVAVFIHQNRFLYIPHGRLNHFCESSSHSPQPPGVNVNSTIRMESGRSLQRLLALISSQSSSRRPQHSWAVATDLGVKWVSERVCVPAYMYAPMHVLLCICGCACLPTLNFCLHFDCCVPYKSCSYMSSQLARRAMCCLISSPARHTLTAYPMLMLNSNNISDHLQTL